MPNAKILSCAMPTGDDSVTHPRVHYISEICTGAVTGTNPWVSAGIPREWEQILRKTRGNNGNGNDFCGNTMGTGPNFTGNTAGICNKFWIDNGLFWLLCTVVDLMSVAYVSERVFFI